MKTVLIFLQIIVSILLIIIILVQAKGTGISTVFGGSGGFYRSKRGVERLFVAATIILAFLFLVFSIAQVIV